MLKQVLHKLFSTTMALLLLFSTVSFTVEKHFCGDILVDTAIFNKVKVCGMEIDKEEPSENRCVITKKSCCKDTLAVIEGQNELTVKTFDDLDFDQQQFLATYIISLESLFETLQKQQVPHEHYNPPNLIADIQVLDQVFLI